ncbi:hypothetical protein [Achromobacter insuavis]|uniref:hypothetical protein n=1 Tax=Achromobacter insuavis TaxID=1287735 RepID=UPI001EEB98C9|nr:hypothetical protein [Achromobacter insuavis]
MTEQLAKKAAERAWQKYKESMTADVRACLRPSDQADWIKVKTEYHLAKGNPMQLSAPFDAPQFAREFIKLAAASGRTSRLCINQADWIKVKTEYHLAKGNPMQLSAPFDAPQFAREFIKLAAASGRTSRLCIMQRGPKLDKHGAPRISKATKRPMITWVPYPR